MSLWTNFPKKRSLCCFSRGLRLTVFSQALEYYDMKPEY